VSEFISSTMLLFASALLVACGGTQSGGQDQGRVDAGRDLAVIDRVVVPSDAGVDAPLPAPDLVVGSDVVVTPDLVATPDAGADPCSRPKPGPDNTGVPAGTVLTPSGSITVMNDGEIVEGLEIAGTITVLADNVTIRKVRITTDDFYPIRYFDNGNTGLLVEDSEIVGTSGDVTSAIAFENYTARRLNINGMSDALKADANDLVEDCWIHDLSNGDGEHNDGIQSTGGKGVTIRHNTISGASNACVQTGDESGNATLDLTIECNWLSGGGYTLNIRGSGATLPRNTRVVNNRFGRDHGFGPWTFDDPAPTVTGNVYDDNDEPIPFP
jgi:hypothetical protein